MSMTNIDRICTFSDWEMWKSRYSAVSGLVQEKQGKARQGKPKQGKARQGKQNNNQKLEKQIGWLISVGK